MTAAKELLLKEGPQALKLVDVAAAAGVGTATVLHYFGSIAGLQSALAETMVRGLAEEVVQARAPANRLERAEIGRRLMFDAFESRGAARLAAWLELTGEFRQLTVVKTAVDEVIEKRIAAAGVPVEDAQDAVLTSILLALAVGLFGSELSELLGRPPETARRLALELLRRQIQSSEAPTPEG